MPHSHNSVLTPRISRLLETDPIFRCGQPYRVQLLDAQDNQCIYCKSVMNDVTVDHVIPFKYGVGSFNNIIYACKDCNGLKCDNVLAIETIDEIRQTYKKIGREFVIDLLVSREDDLVDDFSAIVELYFFNCIHILIEAYSNNVTALEKINKNVVYIKNYVRGIKSTIEWFYLNYKNLDRAAYFWETTKHNTHLGRLLIIRYNFAMHGREPDNPSFRKIIDEYCMRDLTESL